MTDVIKSFIIHVKKSAGQNPKLGDIKASLNAREQRAKVEEYLKDKSLDDLIVDLNNRDDLLEAQTLLLVAKGMQLGVVNSMDDAIKLARGMQTAILRNAVIAIYDQYLNMQWVKNLTTVNSDHEYVEILNKEVVKKNPAYAKSVLKCIASQMLTEDANISHLQSVVKIIQSLEGDIYNLAVKELSPAYQACIKRMEDTQSNSEQIFYASLIRAYVENTGSIESAAKAYQALRGKSFSLIEQYNIYWALTGHRSVSNAASNKYIEVNHLLNTVNLCKLVNADYSLFQSFLESLSGEAQEKICERIMDRWNVIYYALHAGQAGGVFGKTNHGARPMQAEERLNLVSPFGNGSDLPFHNFNLMAANRAAIQEASGKKWRYRLNSLYETKIQPRIVTRSKTAWEYMKLEGNELIRMVYLCAFRNSRTTATSSAIKTERRLFRFGPQRKPEAETKVDLDADEPRLNLVKAALEDIAYPDSGNASKEHSKP